MAVESDLIVKVRRRVHDTYIGEVALTTDPADVYAVKAGPSVGSIPETDGPFDVWTRDVDWYGIVYLGELAYIAVADGDFTVELSVKPFYPNYVYKDAVERGLSRVNLDIDQNYSLAQLPLKYTYLLEIRATIEMCWVRAAEDATDDIHQNPSGAVQSVSVPNLSVSSTVSAKRGPKFWVELARALEAEYENLLAKFDMADGTTASTVQSQVVFRTNRATGRRTPRVMDSPIPAPAFAVGVEGGMVLLSWDVVRDMQFRVYQVRASADAQMGDAKVIYVQPDNHITKFVDEPGSGTWFYQLTLVNMNQLKSVTPIVEVTI